MNDRSESSAALARLFDILNLLSLRRARERALPSSLAAAAFRGDLEMVEVFLAKGADVDEGSPLASAVQSGRPDIVARLLAAGAKPDSRDAAGNAAMRGRTDLLQMLFDAGLDPTSSAARHAVESAAIAGKAEAMRFLIDRGVNVSESDTRLVSMLAARSGHAAIVAFLDGKRADLEGIPDAPDPLAWLLVHPSGRPDDDWSEERLEAEALSIVGSGDVDRELDRPDHRGISALSAAIDADAVSVAEALLARGADPAGSGTKGRPIAEAASHGLSSLVELLVTRAPPKQLDEALSEAAHFGLSAVVGTLLQAGANPASEQGTSALAKASGPYRDEIRTLIRRALRERGTKPAPGLRAEGKKLRKSVAALRGISEMVKPLVDTNPDWTILAVRKPIEEVTPRLATIYGAARAELDVASRGVDSATIGVFVFQLAGHSWTIELRSLGFYHRGRWELDDDTAAAVSREMACEAIHCGGSDTSGTFGVSRYDRGERIEMVEWDFDERKAADAYFTNLELFVPGFRVDSLGISPSLELLRIDPSNIKRLDYLVLVE